MHLLQIHAYLMGKIPSSECQIGQKIFHHNNTVCALPSIQYGLNNVANVVLMLLNNKRAIKFYECIKYNKQLISRGY